MIAANAALFGHLLDYCRDRGDEWPNGDARRFVASDDADKRYLKELRILEVVRFGLRRAIARIAVEEAHYFVTVGFEFDSSVDGLVSVEANGGAVVAILSELRPLPVAPASMVRNIVEVGKMGDVGYIGHDIGSVHSLFPEVRLYECSNMPAESTWRVFLLLGVDECSLGESWVDAGLREGLVNLASIQNADLPYGALCRSIFDWDPTAMYMALYRCIEATYAYEACRRLAVALQVDESWQSIAAVLQKEIGWYPREAQSLVLVLQYADDGDLREICDQLNVGPADDVKVAAARAIYELRNRLVHFRVGQEAVRREAMDWNRLCESMSRVVADVFSTAFRRMDVELGQPLVS
ncbi:hypothetical protein [Modestobacter marinus]|nr:hypothetical protein [Modestobacter marinus]NIH66401.1 hypothetical protein [Modestobacter marinus]